MKRNDAVRLAAAKVEGVSTDHAADVVEEFIAQMARCPVCNGSGEFTFRREYKVGENEWNHLDVRPIAAGATAKCPLCLGEQHDPHHVRWQCFGERSWDRCAVDNPRDSHLECGFHVILPLPDKPTDGS